MTITTLFPSDNLVPGVGGEFDLITGSRALAPVDRKLLLIGTKGTGTATVEKPYQVFDEAGGDTLFGIGSEVALMVRAALATARGLLASQPEIWCMGIAEPGGGTAATGTFTITGTATEAADVVVRIAGRYVRATIKSGDVQNTIATTLRDKINELQRDLPVSASAATNVVTCTYRHKGTNGNDVRIEVVSAPAGVTVTPSGANLTTGAGTIDITNALNAAETADYWAVAISNNEATDISDWKAHADLMWATMSDRYRFIFMADIASLAAAQTLCSTANDEREVIATAAGARSLPGEIAATLACMTQAREKPNYNHCLTEFTHLYGADLDVSYDPTEQQTALTSGATPLVSTKTGGMRLVRLITTKTTNNSVTFRGLLDFAKPYTIARCARELDDLITAALPGKNLDEVWQGDLKSLALRVARGREQAGWLQDVEKHKGEITAEVHPQNRQRSLLQMPWAVVDIAAQVIVKNQLLYP